MPKHPKPTPVVVTEICSECGLDWRFHGDDPTTADCIRLLRAELARRLSWPVARPVPYVPWYPYVNPQPIWYGTTLKGNTCIQTVNSGVDIRSPRAIESTCKAVAS